MCGILGIIDRDGAAPRVTDEQVCALRDRMTSRGPDDATMLRRENVVFAHRRLAIRDPSSGRQPWVSDDGNDALIYNGEIYNDDQLRSELKTHGFQFRTRCDTEVLMAAWQHWGRSCVDHLRGMFAFATYDFQRRELFMARDRLGVKPLFYAEIDGVFVFASAISAIAHHPGFRPRPNLTTIRHYLTTFRITLDRDTVFQGIQTVLPGETLTRRAGRTSTAVYWTPPLAPDEPAPSFDDAVDQLEQTLAEAVSIRLRSDVPVGMMLSGGVDSNTLACMLHRQHGESMTARCGGGVSDAIDPATSDFAYARQCADHVGFDFDQVTVNADQYHETWHDLIAAYDTPISTPTDVIIHRVAHQLTESVGVALGGEGADEACCGYLVPHWSGNDFDLAGPCATQASRESLLRTYGCDSFTSPGAHYLTANGLIPGSTQAQLFRDTAWTEAFADGAVESYYDKLFASLGDMPNVQKSAHLLLKINLESLLSRLDSATMAASLESRVPFTDHHLVEQMFRLPHSYRIDIDPREAERSLTANELAARGSLRGKRVLRSVAGRIMPSQLAERPKASFPTPVPSWLGNEWKSWVAERYATSQFAREIFRPEAITELTQLPSHLSTWNWPIMNTILWADRWFE